MNRSRRGLSGWCAATVLVSAFLLFLVQPMISKMILPWFGGSPAVWTTCMLFFQVFLLAGYAYAHLLDKIPRTRIQGTVHLFLLLAALLVLPIVPSPEWKPHDGGYPQWRILALLTVSVGLPYFLLAASAPLIQAWYRRAFQGRSPYRFYALSNVGSLAALLSYPFLIEPAYSTRGQGALWSWSFVGFAVLSGVLALAMARWDVATDWGLDQDKNDTTTVAGDGRPRPIQYLPWLLLPAFGSIVLLAVTNHICQDVAVVPFLWIAPLSLYLITFIICFDSPRWYRRYVIAIAALVTIGIICAILLDTDVEPILTKMGIRYKLPDFLDNLKLEVGLYLTTLFLVCMLCHGELVRGKPSPRYLTSFYLMIAAGGALGGVFVALICPVIFSSYAESYVVLIGGCLLASVILLRGIWLACRSWPTYIRRGLIRALIVMKRTRLGRAARRLHRNTGTIISVLVPLATSAVLAVLALTALGLSIAVPIQDDYSSSDWKQLAARRNFYGVLSVVRRGSSDTEDLRRLLYNGRILHGIQFLQPSRRDEATTYYNAESGIGLALLNMPRVRPLRVGTIGLGTGTIATYGRTGDVYRFYEINPEVVELCNAYFTFVKDSKARVEIVPGDARLSMEQESPQRYDVLALDAFSGDAIPAHLLTVEAFAVYLRHVRPDGVIAVHTSNRHLDLCPIVALLAKHYEMQVVEIDADGQGGVGDSDSEWLLVTRNTELLAKTDLKSASSAVELPGPDIRVWTDHYSNLFQILRK